MPTIEEKKRIVIDFLGRCNAYADDMLAKYRRQLNEARREDVLAIEDKIAHWTAYRAFNDVAIADVSRGELDNWFPD
jgi:hypothetical protein